LLWQNTMKKILFISTLIILIITIFTATSIVILDLVHTTKVRKDDKAKYLCIPNSGNPSFNKTDLPYANTNIINSTIINPIYLMQSS